MPAGQVRGPTERHCRTAGSGDPVTRLRTILGMTGIRERLAQDVVLGAEGYLFELERRGYVKSGPFVPEVVLDFPEAVRQLHREMLRAGAEVMVAFTYYGHRDKLRSIGREDDLEPLNRQALRLARDVASEGDALLAGNICNTWVYDPDAPETSGEAVREMYREQVQWAVEEGAQLIISETHDYLGEALISLEAIKESGLPAIVTFASTDAVTIDGYAYDEACRQLEANGADVVGLNCSSGPTSPPRRATSASATSASAAVARRTSSARWPSGSAGPCRRAGTRPTWPSIRSSARTSASRRRSS